MKILHVEDSEIDSEIVSNLLHREGMKCEIVRVETRQDFFDEIHKQEFDIILSDCTLPRFSGLEALNLSHTLQPNTPFIFFSGTIGEEAAIESLRHGATDYVLKDWAGRLAPTIRRAVAEREQRRKVVELGQTIQRKREFSAEQQLVSGISHHFNNILTIILGHNALLAKYCTNPDKILNTAAAIEEAANRGAAIVQHLMAMAGQRNLELDRVDLNEFVQGFIDERSQVWPTGVTVRTVLVEDLPLVSLDPHLLEQILDNLVQNSLAALLRDGRGEIEISTGSVEANELNSLLGLSSDESYLTLRVVDTGVGMDKETLGQIFDPFFTTKARGQGLGLSVVKGLMKAHRGEVEVQSERGFGTTVSLYFPLSGAVIHSIAPKPSEPNRFSLAGNETILVVEDEEQLLNFLGIILRGQGYRPLLAKDAEQALELFRAHAHEIQLVVTDVGLPQMDGFTMIGELKKIRPELDTIVVSGNQESAYREKIQQLGVLQFLGKPYRANEIMTTIRSTLDNAKKEQAA